MSLVVLGTSRSGTSLLAAMLNGHSDVVMASEVHQREILLGEDPVWEPASPVARLAGFFAACDTAAGRWPGLRWGNKLTTEVVLYGGGHPAMGIAGAVSEVLGRFPPVPVVYIIRDGRSVVASKLERAGDTIEKACRHWSVGVEFMLALAQHPSPARVVRYEDLVREPDVVASQVCDHLDLPFQGSMLDVTSSDFLLPEYRHGRFAVERTKPAAIPPEALTAIEPDLIRAGYL